jgi:hypothetical protein
VESMQWIALSMYAEFVQRHARSVVEQDVTLTA